MGILDEYNKVYKMTKEREKYMVNNAIIVFDTNVICKLYKYTDESLEIFFDKICMKFKDRLWLPGRVKYEFLKNREKIINNQIDNIKILKEGISNINMVKDFGIRKEDFLQKYDNGIGLKKEDFNEIDTIVDNYNKSFDKLKKKFHKNSNDRIEKLRKLIENDNIFGKIEKNFNIGNDYDANWEKQNLEYLEKRFSNDISPGYKDDNKKGIDKYGDCILWLQIMEYSKSVNKDIIFVTDDNKEDWINTKICGNTIVPKNDLLKEFYDVTNQKFWIYDINGFWNIIKDNFGINIEKLITEDSEIKNIVDTSNNKEIINSINNYWYYDDNKLSSVFKMIRKIDGLYEKGILTKKEYEGLCDIYRESYNSKNEIDNNYIHNSLLGKSQDYDKYHRFTTKADRRDFDKEYINNFERKLYERNLLMHDTDFDDDSILKK